MANKGWLNRQIQKAADTVQSLPEWMRQKEEASSHCATDADKPKSTGDNSSQGKSKTQEKKAE
jgi:hypothetical protein